MNNLIAKQTKIFRRLITIYRLGKIGLDTLIREIEVVNDAIVNIHEEWSDDVTQVIVDLEQINAATIMDRRKMTNDEIEFVNQQLSKLVLLADRLDGDDQDS